MTGLKMTTKTVKEMRAALERGESKTDLEFLHRNHLQILNRLLFIVYFHNIQK